MASANKIWRESYPYGSVRNLLKQPLKVFVIYSFQNSLKNISFFNIFSDSDNDEKANQNDHENISPSGSKRRVTFQSNKETNLNNKSSTKVRLRRLSTTNRLFGERISFSGRNAIYTAGIYL